MWNKEKYPNLAEGHKYALDIVAGRIVANVWVKGACQRYLDDIKRIKKINSWEELDKYKGPQVIPFIFIPEAAEHFLKTVQRFDHPVGHWSSAKIKYEPWQKFIWMNIKGFFSTKTRMVRFRTAHIDVARGNAKSTMASQAALYEFTDKPNGDRVYCAATSRDQAKEVLNGSQIMADKNPRFCKKFGVDVRAHEILQKKTNSYMKAISAQAKSLDGKIGKLIITDELHAMQRETFETLDSGMSKRNDSLLLSITTAGYASDGVGFSQRRYAQKVALGEIEDETFFAMVYRLDEDEEENFLDETIWIKANPNLGVSVDIDNFRAKALKAKENPEDAPNFKIKHLNLYMDSLNQLFNVSKWKVCRDESLKLEDFVGEKCYVGIDLASKIDITSVCYMFRRDEIYYVFWKNFIPKERLKHPKCRMYHRYIEEGDLIALEGEIINIPKIEDIIIEDSRKFRFIDVFYDPWNATELSIRLTQNNIPMTEFKMNIGNLSEPTKAYQANIIANKFRHNTGEMMNWCCSNVVGKRDANDNIFPRKEKEENKIDPKIASIMAMAGWVKQEMDESVYESRGVVVI